MINTEIIFPNLSEITNFEKRINDVFKEVANHDLLFVWYSDGKLTMQFSDDENPNAHNFVKQASAAKYPTFGRIVNSMFKNQEINNFLTFVQLKNVYLLFFSNYSKELFTDD